MNDLNKFHDHYTKLMIEEIHKYLAENPDMEFDQIEYGYSDIDFIKNTYSIKVYYKPKYMKRKQVNLGKAFDALKLLMRDPSLVHKIQDRLTAIDIPHNFLADTIAISAKRDINECLKLIIDTHADNPEMVEGIIGEETWKMIKELHIMK